MGAPNTYQVNPLTRSQRRLKKEQEQAASGSFQQSSDYWNDILQNPDSAAYGEMAAPELRRFNEQIIPDLSEQFAGMGAGGLSSSGFRNAAVNAGTDLSERIGAIRANLRQQAAGSLNQMGQNAVAPYTNTVLENQEQGPSALNYLAQGAAGAATGYLSGGPAGAAVGGLSGLANAYTSKGLNTNSFGTPPVSKKTSPYGGQASPGSTSPYGGQNQPPANYNPNMQLPNFMNR